MTGPIRPHIRKEGRKWWVRIKMQSGRVDFKSFRTLRECQVFCHFFAEAMGYPWKEPPK